jgi:folate-binding protein YgfZ
MATDDQSATLADQPVNLIGPHELSAAQSHAALHGATCATADVSVLEVTGPGVVPCIQGLLTNDVEHGGADGFVYGAVLTPKGMIVSDLWAQRHGGDMHLFPPSNGQAPLQDVFKRSLPPRLARVTDRTTESVVIRLAGPHAIDRITRGGVAVPDARRCTTAEIHGIGCTLARPFGDEPFALQIVAAHNDGERLLEVLAAFDIEIAPAAALELARVVSGWPRLGAEINQRTLPQEVRYDDIEGVSYSKGCYTGQETVARVHFRGHTNKALSGLIWDEGEPDFTRAEITHATKTVGRVTSAVWMHAPRRFAGLGMVRREVAMGETVTAARAPARLTRLPLPIGA